MGQFLMGPRALGLVAGTRRDARYFSVRRSGRSAPFSSVVVVVVFFFFFGAARLGCGDGRFFVSRGRAGPGAGSPRLGRTVATSRSMVAGRWPPPARRARSRADA